MAKTPHEDEERDELEQGEQEQSGPIMGEDLLFGMFVFDDESEG